MGIYLCSLHPHEGAIHLPTIITEVCDTAIDTSHIDSVIVTSKTAVEIARAKLDGFERFEYFCVGEKTAQAVQSYGAKVGFCAKENNARSLAQAIKAHYAMRRFLYLKPKSPAFDMAPYLQRYGVSIRSHTLYRTLCNPSLNRQNPPAPKSVLIFTSPSSVRCFMKHYPLDNRYQIVAIGATTRAQIPQNLRVHTPPKADIASCITLAKGLEGGRI